MSHCDLRMLEHIFNLSQHHKWSVSDIEGLMPWELQAYSSLLSGFLEQQEMLRKQQQSNLQ